MSILIKGGRIVTAADDYVGDVFVEGERIALIGESLDVEADRAIDASGKYVLPGCVDPHTHLDMPFGGTVTIDDVESGQTAAAFGGTTCHVDFVIQPKGATFAAALDEWKAKADGKQVIDMGYHMAVTDLHEGGTLEELASLPDQGVTSYKLFMAYKGALMVDDETLFRTMEVAAETGALVMVHAENGDAIDVLVKQALAEGNTEPKYHALTRPPETEGEATNRAIQLSRVAGHRSTSSTSPAPRRSSRSRSRARRGGTSGARPARSTSSSTTRSSSGRTSRARSTSTRRRRGTKANQDVLWNAVRTDVLSAISTDHCAFNWDGQKTLGRDDFSKIPNGGPGLENRLQMIHEFGVRAGPDLAQPDGRAPVYEPGEALRPLPAQGNGRGRLGRRPRRLRSGEASTRSRPRRSTRGSTTTSTRAPRSRARRSSSSCAETCSSRTTSSSPSREIGQFVRRARFGEQLARAGAAAGV